MAEYRYDPLPGTIIVPGLKSERNVYYFLLLTAAVAASFIAHRTTWPYLLVLLPSLTLAHLFNDQVVHRWVSFPTPLDEKAAIRESIMTLVVLFFGIVGFLGVSWQQ